MLSKMLTKGGTVLLICLVFLCGCSKEKTTRLEIAKDFSKEQTVYEKIQKKLIELETYESEATVEYISNKGRNSYDVVQKCKLTGEYRVEVVGPKMVAGNVTLSDGKTIYQFNPKISARVSVGIKENQERSEIFVTSFIKNYLNSNEVSISVGSFGEGKCTVLEAKIPGAHPYLSTEKLWVDNKTLAPLKLEIYDPDGKERIVVTFKTFNYNVPLSDELFSYN